MLRKIYFVKGGKPSGDVEFDGKNEEFDSKIEELIDLLNLREEKCEDCDCDCDYNIEEDLDYDPEEDEEDFLEEDSDFNKKILIDRHEIEEKVYEFNFFDEETGELIWSYYGDYDYNVAKNKFVEEYDHLDVTFYLADF